MVVLHPYPVRLQTQNGVAPTDTYVADSYITFTTSTQLGHVPLGPEVHDVECSCKIVLLVEGLQHEIICILGFILLEQVGDAVALGTLGVHERLGVWTITELTLEVLLVEHAATHALLLL